MAVYLEAQTKDTAGLVTFKQSTGFTYVCAARFTAASSATLSALVIYLGTAGNNEIIAELRGGSSNSNYLADAVLATGTLAVGSQTGNADNTITFATPYAVTASTNYWILFKTAGTGAGNVAGITTAYNNVFTRMQGVYLEADYYAGTLNDHAIGWFQLISTPAASNNGAGFFMMMR